MIKLQIIIACVFLINLNAKSERGRVSMSNGTVVSDMGTMLRGAFINTD